MPPKFKFTKEEITAAAVEVVRERGMECVTANAVAEKLNSSAKVIFGLFNGMDELKACAEGEIKNLFKEFMKEYLPANGAAGYIRFAVTESNLFRLLFMSQRGTTPDVNFALPHFDEHYENNLRYSVEKYGLEQEAAERIYNDVWIYAHGMAVLCVTGACYFSEEEIVAKIKKLFFTLVKEEKGE